MNADPRYDTVQLDGDGLDDRLVALVAPTSFAAAQYRSLAYSLRADRPELHLIAVCSPALGDGKSTTAVNVGGAMARDDGARVLVVDSDLRRPAVAQLLGLTDRPGVSELLEDESRSIDDHVISIPEYRLSVLPAGRRLDDPYRAFQTRRWKQLLEALRGHFDRIVFDTPPLLPVPDGQVIAAGVDGVLLVVAAHHTRRTFVEEALSALDPAKVLGIVFNADDESPSRYGRYHGEYYQRPGN
jgi:capsular exopolysaccharide synthesis family protein